MDGVRKVLVGGSFAPPLTDETLARYRSLIGKLPAGPVRDALGGLLRCCEAWWNLPEPAGTKTWDHPAGVGTVVSLADDHAAALDPHVPWDHELAATQELLEGISNETDKPLRDAAFHLLWHVKELSLGREPLTTDRLRVPNKFSATGFDDPVKKGK